MDPGRAAQLFERHHLAVYRFLRQSTRSRHSAEDLTQEVFVRIVRGLARYEERLRERAWVFRIARNVLIDWHRREASRFVAELPLDAAAEALSRPRQADGIALSEALDAIREEEREALLLRELAGLGYEEIGALVDATPDAVRMRIYRARLGLRAWLAGSPGSTVAGGQRENVR